MKPGEIPGEFSDALDPSVNRELDNPKLEKRELQAMAMNTVETAERKSVGEQRQGQDLFEYMESLPEVEDPFEPFPPEEEVPPQPERTRAQLMASFIRERCASALITPRKMIEDEEEDFGTLLAELKADESCEDIVSVCGQRDEYYYSNETMANNYAKIAMLTLEKDDARTVAEMVRFNCRAFPTPTPVYYFARQPFFLDRERMKAVIAQMKQNPEYQDIRECTAEINGEPYLYSIDLMSEKYAKALANGAEAREADD